VQISKLRLSGFKSFVQPTELLIEPGLTGVVGPNGCGKSNLIDALRWVMGESSAKGLRGGEMDDVIFAGTASRPAFDLAEVSLQILADDGSVPGFEGLDDLELSRRIGRGTGSVYRVNGKELRARDVQLLFADAASGARSAAIVSQGRIGALVEAKPTERRKLLEDAAGIGGLQARRHEAELKLQAAEANLVRVGDLLATLDEQFAGLKKQARQTERYRQLSASCREVEAALLIGRCRIAEAERAAAERALAGGRAQVDAQGGRLNQARAARDRAAAALPELRRAEAAVATELARLEERRRALDAERARVETSQARLAEQERQTAADLRHAGASVADAEAARARLAAERARLMDAGAADGAALAEAKAAEAAAASLLAEADGAVRAKVAERAEIEAALGQLRARCAEAAAERSRLVALQAELETQRRVLDQALAARPAGRPVGEAEAALAAALQANGEAEAMLAAAEQRHATQAVDLAEQDRARQAAREALRSAEEALRRAAAERQLLSERAQELASRLQRLGRRRDELTIKASARRSERAGLDLAGLEAAAAAADRALIATAAALAGAREAAQGAQAARDAASAAEAEQRQRLERLAAEAQALAELAEPSADGPALIDQVEVADGYADALAAALGDDLLGGDDPARPSFWNGLGAKPDPSAPALPAGCRPLAELVKGPPALARRLAQVGLVESGEAGRLQGSLAQGQRLVSPEGGLWRWDGFVRRPAASRSAAARLRQQARRRELVAELAVAERDLARHRAARTEAESALATAQAALKRAEAEQRAAQQQRDGARERAAGARARDAACAAELAPLAEELTRLDAETAEVAEGRAALGIQLEGLPAPSEAVLAPLRQAAQVAEAAHGRAAAAEREAAAALTTARQAAAAARQRVADAQAGLEASRSAAHAAETALQARTIERAQLDERLARQAADLAGLEQRLVYDGAAMAERSTALQAVELALTAAETHAAAARGGQARAAAQLVALRDRQADAERRGAALAEELAAWAARIEAAQARSEELTRRRTQIIAELADLAEVPKRLAEEEAGSARAIAAAQARRDGLAEALAAGEAALAEAQGALDRIEAERAEARESRARLEARLERAQAELQAAAQALHARLGEGVEVLPGEPPDPDQLATLEGKLASLTASRERLGPVNLRAIDEARELELRIATLRAEEAELTGAIERLRRAIGALNREGRDRLRHAFGAVEQHFEALFVRLFGGGRAKLELTDLEDPLNAGLELSASPPGKKLQALSLLSGGEKALTALALIFAVFLTRPAPLCVLDEVDAPLDDANVERMAALLEELAEATRTRFILVTHHPVTMARMDRLYGVTMVERGVSQLVGVDLTTAVDLRATA
jgi:chromosome segregation protein